MFVRISSFLLFLVLFSCTKTETPSKISVYISESTPQTDFALANAGRLFGIADFEQATTAESADIIVRIAKENDLPEVAAEGFDMVNEDGLFITGKDATGALYGLLEVAEQLSFGMELAHVQDQQVSPDLANRFIKFNLPWQSYRKGPALDVHEATCRDTLFWAAFLDNMVVNRFNVLSLWNLHPFTDMVRLEKYPEASPFTAEEMATKRQFWTAVFRMAKARGVQTYLVNWNIFVSEPFAEAHGIAGYSKTGGYWGEADNSALIEDYTRECVRQLIDDYPDLTGFGLTLGERMGGMTSPERKEWVDRTILQGMAMANRKAKLLYRAPLSAGKSSRGTTDKSTEVITREVLDTLSVAEETVISFKYNWSHGHSSDQLFIVHGGELTDTYWNPTPENYSMMWTIRNEDFFTLRWGQPDFVRRFLHNNTSQPYVTGCVLGSECYLPAADYSAKDFPGKPYTYAFERQWLWYDIWGRLLYDHDASDDLFANQFNRRFGINYGDELLETWKRASDYYHHFASFYKGTWDATLYAEAFASIIRAEGTDRKGMSIITMDALGNRPVLDTVRYQNISDYVQDKSVKQAGRMKPPELANLLRDNADKILTDVTDYRGRGETTLALEIELTDLETLAWLQRFFATRIEATLLLAEHLLLDHPRQDAAIESLLDESIAQWKTLTALKETYNKAVIPHVFDDALDYDDYLEVLMAEREDFREIAGFWVHDLR